MRYLAIYDMDRTITRSPTWTPFLIHAARRLAPWRLALIPVAAAASLCYGAGLISRGRLKQITQKLMIGRRLSPDDRTIIANAFADAVVRNGVFEKALDRIAADREAGYELVLATASYRFYAEAIARRLNFDAVVATESIFGEEGYLLPKIAGENCYGEAKLAMIKGWMRREAIARDEAYIRFYSDHVSDAPAFAFADEPFAVNPHDALAKLAAKQDWPMLDWRA